MREVEIELDPANDVHEVVEVEGVIVGVPERGEILLHRGRLCGEVMDVAQRIGVQHVVDKPLPLRVQSRLGVRGVGGGIARVLILRRVFGDSLVKVLVLFGRVTSATRNRRPSLGSL